jgi:hypothetical protein
LVNNAKEFGIKLKSSNDLVLVFKETYLRQSIELQAALKDLVENQEKVTVLSTEKRDLLA